jgi:hypothetical protein
LCAGGVCKWHATYHWKAFNKGYNFALDLTSIEGLHTKLWASKIAGVLILGISGLPLGNCGTKWHLGASPVARHREYYKEEGGGFPKSRLWWVLWVRAYPWLVVHQKCSNYALTNLLFGLCKFVWIIDLLVNIPNPHLRALAHPSTFKVLWARERAPTPCPSNVFTLWTHSWFHRRVGGASINIIVH